MSANANLESDAVVDEMSHEFEIEFSDFLNSILFFFLTPPSLIFLLDIHSI